MKRTRVAEGIYKDTTGHLSGVVKARGIQRERRFAPGTQLRTINDWRERERVRLKDDRPRAERHTLAHDIERYLDTLSDRRDLKKERTRQLAWWSVRLGKRRRSEIDAAMIRTALAELRSEKEASTCNHYRLALAHLWTTLDGKDARNPLRNVPTFEEPEAEARGLSDRLVDLFFEQLPDVGRTVKGQRRSDVSLTKIRLRVMVEAGFSPAEIKRLQPRDLDYLNLNAVYVRRRQKGKGAEGVLMPITTKAVAALQAFDRANAYGIFAKRPMYASVTRACKQLLKREDLSPAERRVLEDARPYDFRHTFGTNALKHTKDLRVTQELMRHKSTKTTKRYTRGAMFDHLRDAVDRLDAAGKPAEPKNEVGQSGISGDILQASDRVH